MSGVSACGDKLISVATIEASREGRRAGRAGCIRGESPPMPVFRASACCMVYPSAFRTDVASVDRRSTRQSRYGFPGYDEDDDGRSSFS